MSYCETAGERLEKFFVVRAVELEIDNEYEAYLLSLTEQERVRLASVSDLLTLGHISHSTKGQPWDLQIRTGKGVVLNMTPDKLEVKTHFI